MNRRPQEPAKKSIKTDEYIDVEQLYKLAARSGRSINVNVISNSQVTIQSDQRTEIHIGNLINDVQKLKLHKEKKTVIVRCLNEIEKEVENKASWEKIVEKITTLLSLGKEALPVVQQLLKWLMNLNLY